ncbi:MAG: endonuclease MutS2 [Thermodesulfovibrionales bacterium]|nr:endonuclease MutS2 [Thermodesulfovibrionales bacterium]
MDENSLRLLEFHKVLEEISLYARSPASKRLILSIRPLGYKDEIEKRFHLVAELRRVISEGREIALDEFDDLSGILQKLRPEGSFIEPEELYTLRKVFLNIERIRNSVGTAKDIPHLSHLISGMGDFKDLIDLIDRSVDHEGNILDTASHELREIRRRKRNLEQGIRKRLDEIIHARELAPAIQDEYVTIRGGRWVIPLKADFKGKIPGVIHDISRTGETLYVEPLEIVELANEHENIIAEEKAEEIRVLRGISSLLRADLSKIEASYGNLIYFDLLRSIALFSERLGLTEPEIDSEQRLQLFGARHPVLLLLKEKRVIQDVVPLDLELGGSHRIMIITGPNAGGKTIALKTAGLLTIMALSGIPVPAQSGSVLPFVSDVLVDMGDEQSIEENLSTFSGHIKNVSDIINRSKPEVLVLLDEIGRATDPSEGAALSCAILEELKMRGSTVIATTHLLEVAAFVSNTEGMVNASMEFDESLMRPLYRLRMGLPGQSHGISIAERFGLPENIIRRAKEFIGKGKLDFQLVLDDLRKKQKFYELELERLRKLQQEISEKERILQEKESELVIKKKEIIRKALEESKELLNETKVFINKLIMEAKRSPKESIKNLRAKEMEIEKALNEFKKKEEVFIPEPGSKVYIKSLGYDGVVMRVESDRVRVRAGAFEAEVALSDIEAPRGILLKSYEERMPEERVAESINLTGMTVEEALSRLETYLNHASLAGLSGVKIIHGLGTGRLKRAVRDYLKGHPLVDNFRPGNTEEGGDGVSIVKLK